MTAAGFDPTALAGRTALVTGAGSGIGRATARSLAELGAAVACLDRDGAAAIETASLIETDGARAVAWTVDLAEVDALGNVVADIVAALGPITILVNNAGILAPPLLDSTLDDWNRCLTVNLTAPFVLLQDIGRRMIENGHGGSIVNISSSSAYRAVSTSGAYGVSKAGISALTRGAAWELGEYDVNVNTVAPGVTRSGITRNAFGSDEALDQAIASGPLANLLHRVSEAEDVANVVTFLCLPASRQITGQVIHTSAGAVIAAG